MPPTRSCVIGPATDRTGPGPAAEAQTANNPRQSRRFPPLPKPSHRPPEASKKTPFPQPEGWAEGKAIDAWPEKPGQKKSEGLGSQRRGRLVGRLGPLLRPGHPRSVGLGGRVASRLGSRSRRAGSSSRSTLRRDDLGRFRRSFHTFSRPTGLRCRGNNRRDRRGLRFRATGGDDDGGNGKRQPTGETTSSHQLESLGKAGEVVVCRSARGHAPRLRRAADLSAGGPTGSLVGQSVNRPTSREPGRRPSRTTATSCQDRWRR